MFQALKDFFLNNYFIVFSQARQQNDPTEICDSICQRILASTSSMQNKAVRVVVAERSQTIYSWIRWVQTILSKSQKLCSKKGSSNYWGSAEENSLWDLPKMLSKMQSVVGEKKHPHSGILEWSSREIHFFSIAVQHPELWIILLRANTPDGVYGICCLSQDKSLYEMFLPR